MLLSRATQRLPVLFPLAAALGLGCAGTAAPQGVFVSVSVAPQAVALAVGEAQQFSARVEGASDASVVWSVVEGDAAGTVTREGLYRAQGVGTQHLVAASRAFPGATATATVTVVPAPPGEVRVTVAPAAAAVAPNATVQLVATVAGAADTSVDWSVQEGAAFGAVSARGLYTAPAAGDRVAHVQAKSRADASKIAVASIAVASAGCGRASPTGELQAQQILVGGTTRTYFLSVPTGLDPSRPLPLVFGYHGAGGTGRYTQPLLGLEGGDPSGPGTGNAIFIYPDGVGGGWDLSETGADVQMFDALVQFAGANYCVDKRRVFAAGFSFGHTMSNMLGCYRGGAVRAVAGDGGGIIPSEPDCHGQRAPAWIAYGTNDGYLPAYGWHTRDFWIARNHCSTDSGPVDPSPCVSFSGCDPGYPVVWCLWPGQHEWPSFAAGGVWRFFSSFN